MSEYNNIPKIRFKGFTDVWEQRKLGEKYKFQYGEYNNNPDNGGIYPIYGANGIIGGYTKFNAEDSIIIGHMGEYAGSVLWGEGKHFVTYNGTISSPKDTSINSKFGYYMLLHKNINKICGGSGLPFLSYEQLNKIDVDYPLEKEEQNKISILFKNIDNLITLHQRKCDKLINIKKSMLEKMFPKNSSNIPEIRFKGFTDVWEQRKLGEKYKFQYGEYNNNPDNGGIYPIYGANGIIGGYTKFNAEDSIIIGHMGEYAGSVLWGEGKHFVTYNGTISSPKDTSINSKFGYYMLLHKNINKICGGSGLPFLSYEQLNKIDVDYPLEKEEQNKISILFKNIDNLITLHQRKVEKLNNIKKSMLEKMFV